MFGVWAETVVAAARKSVAIASRLSMVLRSLRHTRPRYSIHAPSVGLLVPRPRSPVNTEGGDAPRAQGARRAHTGSMQPTSNAAPGDAAPAECNRTSGTRYY